MNRTNTYYKLISSIFIFLIIFTYNSAISEDTVLLDQNREIGSMQSWSNYEYPKFYKGIYLNIYSAQNFEKLLGFIKKAKTIGINTLVLDVQAGNSDNCAVPMENIRYCMENDLHTVARIVVFQDGLSQYPVEEEIINNRLNIAEDASRNGFKEIQFDYIRFSDSRISKRLSLKEKYSFIEDFLKKARNRLKAYDVKIAADIFGRIPLNTNDAIGQKIEIFDNVVDIICPMAYPSHYTWSKKMMSNPYYTVFLTSKCARERTKNAEIVTYIQAFKMKISNSKLTFEKYIEEQVRAVHDAGVKGFILWNASQDYDVPFQVLGKYYQSTSEAKITELNGESS